ncbi:MAG: transposase IS200-family protein, putative transposase [Berkelbacteria bacterium GW2011_GWE1_39_12]|uniref:Transposase IS200-family protein, putative transposase n=1 Tax=Berkelbacteria bacterium GW2011_GWE1_39_12 TaxID=1618337 RepID=A0A0G4B3E6_9BACT|nr:MAG: transposase IS200-family protein, putative transposase [Berkelbacteria bacterium GW2011_GWE1_39_12]AKM82806.1 MAG: transposase IS200-family protein, putative transposase [Berkelbacteria bacterium GW2011_GWE1_39_12]
MILLSNSRLYQLNHALYCCRYHLVWSPKYRGRVMCSTYIKQEFERIFKMIAKWKGLVIYEIHIADDHIHIYISIPPKYSVSYAMSILKGKSSAWIKKKNKKIPLGTFWSRGYFVSTIGISEIAIRKYIQNQDKQQSAQPVLL